MPRISRLILQDFRSYPVLDLVVDAPMLVLCGENGAGKTNILEALSLFTPGRGLRRAELADMAWSGGTGGFSASVTLDEGTGGTRLGVGLTGPDGQGQRSRLTRIDGAAAATSGFAEHLRLVWLTPDFDGLFRGSAGERRRFLDRLVLAVDPGHAARSNALDRALRSRNRLLDESPHETGWLDAIEREVAELGIAVAAARAETVTRLSALIAMTRTENSPFPYAELALVGDIDRLVASFPAVDAEDHYRRDLRTSRWRDKAAGRTLIGPQASDLEVRHGPKDIVASQGSTGEQKALLIGLVLAHARLVAAMSGLQPLVLLDEIAAHLDPRRRAALYEELSAIGGQVWMTGADVALFSDLPPDARLLHVTQGRVNEAGESLLPLPAR